MADDQTLDPDTYHVDPSTFDAASVQLPSQPTKTLSFVAFDDFVTWPSGGTTFLSPSSLDWLMGNFDQLAIEGVVDAFAGSSLTVSAQLQHSADGIHYLDKASSPEIPVTSLPRVSQTTVLPIGYDDGSGLPSLAFVRILFTVTGGSGVMHLKATVTGNNTKEQRFTASIEDFVAQSFLGADCVRWHESGTMVYVTRFQEYAGIESPPVPIAYFDVYPQAHLYAPKNVWVRFEARLKKPYRICEQKGGRIFVLDHNKPLWASDPSQPPISFTTNVSKYFQWSDKPWTGDDTSPQPPPGTD